MDRTPSLSDRRRPQERAPMGAAVPPARSWRLCGASKVGTGARSPSALPRPRPVPHRQRPPTVKRGEDYGSAIPTVDGCLGEPLRLPSALVAGVALVITLITTPL